MKNKNKEFESGDLKLAHFMRVMAHPPRVSIMRLLAKVNTCVEGEIIKGLPLSDHVLSQHLLALESAGLIKGSTRAIRSYYCINWDTFREFSEHFHTLFHDFQENKVNQNCQVKRRKLSGDKGTF